MPALLVYCILREFFLSQERFIQKSLGEENWTDLSLIASQNLYHYLVPVESKSNAGF